MYVNLKPRQGLNSRSRVPKMDAMTAVPFCVQMLYPPYQQQQQWYFISQPHDNHVTTMRGFGGKIASYFGGKVGVLLAAKTNLIWGARFTGWPDAFCEKNRPNCILPNLTTRLISEQTGLKIWAIFPDVYFPKIAQRCERLKSSKILPIWSPWRCT
jgi:hypothetical protein